MTASVHDPVLRPIHKIDRQRFRRQLSAGVECIAGRVIDVAQGRAEGISHRVDAAGGVVLIAQVGVAGRVVCVTVFFHQPVLIRGIAVCRLVVGVRFCPARFNLVSGDCAQGRVVREFLHAAIGVVDLRDPLVGIAQVNCGVITFVGGAIEIVCVFVIGIPDKWTVPTCK